MRLFAWDRLSFPTQSTQKHCHLLSTPSMLPAFKQPACWGSSVQNSNVLFLSHGRQLESSALGSLGTSPRWKQSVKHKTFISEIPQFWVWKGWGGISELFPSVCTCIHDHKPVAHAGLANCYPCFLGHYKFVYVLLKGLLKSILLSRTL